MLHTTAEVNSRLIFFMMHPQQPSTTYRDAPQPQPEADGQQPPQHHSVYCPNCSSHLTGHRCKLICNRCGYYLSCADYY